MNLASYFQAHLYEFYHALVILVVTLFMAKLVGFWIERYIKSTASRLHRKIRPQDLTRIQVIIKIIVFGIYFFGFISALYQFGAISKIATALFASAGIVGIVVGTAARSTLDNVLSSFIIFTSQPFRIGDEIKFEDKRGRVCEISLSYTKIKLKDGSILFVPNQKLTASSIINFSLKE